MKKRGNYSHFGEILITPYCLSSVESLLYIQYTVGENIIATTKIRNNYGPIHSFKFPILDFSLLRLVKLSLLFLFATFFDISSLLLF